MNFLDMMEKNKKNILEEWISSITNSYSSETSAFIKNNQDPFANPVGHTILNSLTNLLNDLIYGTDIKKLELHIDPIIRIRSVQGFKASEAVKFTFMLKNIVHNTFLNIKQNIQDLSDELLLFNNRIDMLAMVAFDVYMICREKIYELKANESRNQFFSSLSRAGLIKET